jgi:hypothetical protein
VRPDRVFGFLILLLAVIHFALAGACRILIKQLLVRGGRYSEGRSPHCRVELVAPSFLKAIELATDICITSLSTINTSNKSLRTVSSTHSKKFDTTFSNWRIALDPLKTLKNYGMESKSWSSII